MAKQSELDYTPLIDFLKKEATTKSGDKLEVASVKHRMKKVAFDVYSVDNDPYDGLWRLESNADDGKEYLVRLESDNTENKTADWTAISNENGDSITLAYKKVPIQRFSAKTYGFSKDDVSFFKKAMIEKLSADTDFVSKILDLQTDSRKSEIVRVFPELAIKK